MFSSLRLHGGQADVLWHHQPAISVRSWLIAKDKKTQAWTLSGQIHWINSFYARQTPLLFTAPREKGMWAWPITSLQLGSKELIATLGPPEQ